MQTRAFYIGLIAVLIGCGTASTEQQRADLSPQTIEWLTRARAAFDAGAYPWALVLVDSAVAEVPAFAEAHFLRAAVLDRLDRTEEAEAAYSRALELEIERSRLIVQQAPESTKHWLNLADLLVRTRRFDEAVESFETVLALEPDNLPVRNDRANLALVLGDTATAVNQYRTIIAYDSTFADAWANLGVVHAVSGQIAQARLAWGQALKHDPNHPVARENLIRLDARE